MVTKLIIKDITKDPILIDAESRRARDQFFHNGYNLEVEAALTYDNKQIIICEVLN